MQIILPQIEQKVKANKAEINYTIGLGKQNSPRS